MKKILVTGASGFIGWHAIQPLLDKGVKVYGVCNKGELPPQKGLRTVRMNLLDTETMRRAVEDIRPEGLLHLAWDVNPASYVHSISNLEWLHGSMELIKAACENGCKKVVTAGTCFEYEMEETAINECGLLTNKNLYAASKGSMYNLCSAYCRRMGIPYAHGRIFYAYGAREHEQRVVPYVIRSLLERREASVSSGIQLRDYIYTQDVANAFVAILNSRLEGAVNIGTGGAIELRELFLEIGRQLGCPELIRFGVVVPQSAEPKLIAADNKKLVDGTSWQPMFSLDMGVRMSIDWWKAALHK